MIPIRRMTDGVIEHPMQVWADLDVTLPQTENVGKNWFALDM